LYAEWRDELDLFDVRSIEDEWSIVVHGKNADEFQTPVVDHRGLAEEGKGLRDHP
jgi:hypothetical protein